MDMVEYLESAAGSLYRAKQNGDKKECARVLRKVAEVCNKAADEADK